MGIMAVSRRVASQGVLTTDEDDDEEYFATVGTQITEF